MVMVMHPNMQVHEGDCYLLALDLLQQHAATLGAAAIADSAVHSIFTHASVRCRPLAVCCDCIATAPPLLSSTSLHATTATRSWSLHAVRVLTDVMLLRFTRRALEPAPACGAALPARSGEAAAPPCMATPGFTLS